MNTITPDTLINAPRNGDFESAINLLAVLGEARRMLDDMEREIERGYLELVAGQRERYAKIQSTISETEAALEVIARRNQSWFSDAKTVKTPYGAVKFTSSKELVVANEEASIVLIKAAGRKELLRETVELNREALAELDDVELATFGLARKPKENLKVDTNVVNLGKAVKTVEKSEKNAAKAAKKAAQAMGE